MTFDTKMEDGKEGIISSTKPYEDAVIGYGRASTVHGVYYVFEQGRWAVERVIWGVIIIVAICLAIWWSLVAYDRWQDDPVTITMATNALPIQNIPFPSITICPQGIWDIDQIPVTIENIYRAPWYLWILSQ